MSNKEEESEIRSIIEGFQMFNSDSDSLINPIELKEIMEIMNYSQKNPFIYNIIKELCSNPNINEKGGINPEDFISLLDEGLNDTTSIDGFQKIFTALYTPSTNKICLRDIQNIDKNIENNDIIKNLLSKPEIKGKEIDFNEFVDIMKINEDNQNNDKNNSNINEKKENLNKNAYLNFVKNNNLSRNKIKKVENNFSNKMLNNNSNYNSINNINTPLNSSEKMEDLFSSRDKSIPFFNERNINDYNNNNYINNDINNFDNNNYKNNKIQRNIENDDNEHKEEKIITKKKYRYMRKKERNNFEEDQEINQNKNKNKNESLNDNNNEKIDLK